MTDDVFHGLQNRKIGRGLIAAAEWGDVTLEVPLQLQSERRRDDHVAGRLVFARVEVAGVKINGEENRVRKRGTERLDDEKSVIGISAQYPDGSRPLPFIMNACGWCAHVIDLAGALGSVTRRIPGLCYCLGSPSGSRRIVAGYFAIQSAEVAIAEDIEGERFVIGWPSNLQIDGPWNCRTPGFDVDGYLDLLQVGFREGRYFGAGGGTKFDG